ncbi:MAG: AraC family transcriptional regulator [Prevotellaceae bacterium]|jgi:AraC-like DNA-binding protein|nr:AraC family transcriptional regulator [Prevotellaceae bacterium]
MKRTSNTASILEEVSPLSAEDCFIIIERKKDHFDFPVHVHPEYELNLIERAAGALRIVGDSMEEIGDVDLVFVANPRLEHAWFDHRNQSSDIYEVTIQMHPDLMSDTFLGREQLSSLKSLFDAARNGVAFDEATIRRVRPLLSELIKETEGFYALIKLFGLLHELSLSTGMRQLASRSFTAVLPQKVDNRLERVMNYLKEHYPSVIYMPDVAGHIGMSPSAFNRFIKQQTGSRFVDLLVDIRIGFAARALVDTDQSIAEVCDKCGFNNQSNFNRAFKKKKGITPTEFRDNYRKNKTIV